MASWTTPVTHASGDILAVSDWNGVANNETFLYQKPYGSAYATAATSIPSGTITPVPMGGTVRLGYGFSINSSGALVAPIAGIYRAFTNVYWTSPATSGYGAASLSQNGTQIKQGLQLALTDGQAIGYGCTAQLSCSASDTIATLFLQSSGSSADTLTGSALTYLEAEFIGSA